MFQRMSRGWKISKQSFRVLRLDKELLMFPLFSGLACLVVMASFIVPLWGLDVAEVDGGSPLVYLVLFAFYFSNYFVIIFFNSALIACAIIRFRGGDPTVGDGLSVAMSRVPYIFGWALVAATVGLILRVIESNSEKVGRFVAGLLGMAWSASTYFVVPVLVVEKTGPIEAIKRSFAVLRKTWGESLGANFGTGLMVFLMTLAALLPLGLGLILGHPIAIIVGVVTTVLLIILISLISAAVNAISIAALYLYAAEGSVPENFDDQLLHEAFVQK